MASGMTLESQTTPHRLGTSNETRIIVACGIGTALEWFDFVAYAMFAPIIARTFFPTGSELTSLLATFGAFTAGFVMRPLGALLLGNYADSSGRKAALSASILLMAVGTGLMAIIPGYSRIGIAAPLLITCARLIQGLSTGGEVGCAFSFLAEHAPPSRRGYFLSWQQASVGLFYILAGIVGFALTATLTPQQVESWGWRVPFVLGMAIAPVGFYIRSTLSESPFFTRTPVKQAHHLPVVELLTRHFRPFLVGVGLTLCWAVCSQLINYMPTYSVRDLGMSRANAFQGFLVVGTILLASPMIGRYADYVGRRRLMTGAAIGMLVLTYPLFAVVTSRSSVGFFIAAQCILSTLLLLYSAPAAAALAEQYPTSVRSSGVALSYSAATTLFGSITPLVSLLLVNATANKAAVACYLMAAAALSLVALAFMKDRTGESLS